MADKNLNSLLQQQIHEHLPSVDVSSSPLQAFLSAVNTSYQKFDVDLSELEQSLTQSAKELLQANDEMNAVFKAIPDQLFHFDANARIISYKLGPNNHHYLKSDQLINKNISDVFDIEVVELFKQSISQVLTQLASTSFEITIYFEGKIYYYEVRMLQVASKAVIALIRDITKYKQEDEKRSFIELHDELTELPNSRLFKDRLEHAISLAERNEKILAVMFLDLNRFKLINSSLGHKAGDELLKITSQRLVETLRKTDSVAVNVSGISSSVARLGGDEFTILLDDIENITAVVRIVERIIENISQPMTIDSKVVYISSSIGIAMYPDDGAQAEDILKHADSAMNYAKEQGSNKFKFYADSMNKSSDELLLLESDLRKALEKDEFYLHYQPQYHATSEKMVGMEALIRWQHPEKGLISPGIFIPIAEETGMIEKIGEWVLREACEQGVRWLNAGYEINKIAVNVSAQQLREDSLPEAIALILEETGMPVENLCVELTETAMIVDPDEALLVLKKIKKLGVSLSLDDFGTGYSSLSYLKRFPIDTLKIDQAFIRDVKVDQENAALVKAIIAMAHGLDMDVVAEGVEDAEQLGFLNINDCDTIQGFWFSRPLPVDELEKILSKKVSTHKSV